MTPVAERRCRPTNAETAPARAARCASDARAWWSRRRSQAWRNATRLAARRRRMRACVLRRGRSCATSPGQIRCFVLLKTFVASPADDRHLRCALAPSAALRSIVSEECSSDGTA